MRPEGGSLRIPRALLGMLLLLALSIAGACGGDDGGGGTGGGGDAAEAVNAQTCDDPVGNGEFMIVSDLPLQGASRLQTVQMVNAIRYVLEQHNFRAGDVTLSYQSCDDSSAQAGKWESAICSSNANAYARNPDVIGVIGTFNSGCAQIEIPILNRAPGGAVAMVSPANTWPGLTVAGPGTAPGEPDKYYPTGTRNYARVVAIDDAQAAANVQFMQDQGVKSVYILNDKEAYGLGVASYLQTSAEAAGIEVKGFAAWDPRQSNYQSLMQKIGQTNPDAIFLGGLICENGGQLIKDKVAVLGPNTGADAVQLYAPDGFTTTATIEGEGSAGPENAEGMYLSVAGVPADELTGPGKEFVDGFKQQYNLDVVEPYTAYAAQAAELMIEAIEKAGGERARVAENLFGLQIQDSILGTFAINDNGDVDTREMTINVVKDGAMVPAEVVEPDPSLIGG
jgi:branched-chain amino acid transport system substrate-binding protein